MIADHEVSESHEAAISALFNAKAEIDVAALIDKNFYRKKNQDVETNIEVLGRIIRAIKFLGT